uniref:HIG1 hypoxia inducible domain family, member 2A n=3 Tax=Cyprinus carpio TaxID=7962 RepID=A0A8C1HP35_CYPCA
MSCDVQLAEMPCSLFLFHFLLAEVLSMATATTPVGQDQPTTADPPPVVFDLSQPPVIEGFAPLPRAKEENFKDKFIRKTKENPFVPIGCLGTAGALIYGLSAFRRGKTRQSQLLMRARIFAQGFTVVAIIVGVATTALKPKQ